MGYLVPKRLPRAKKMVCDVQFLRVRKCHRLHVADAPSGEAWIKPPSHGAGCWRVFWELGGLVLPFCFVFLYDHWVFVVHPK